MPIDPICGMNVKASRALKLSKGSRDYFFCGKTCLDKFTHDEEVDAAKVSCCASGSGKPFFLNKSLLVAIALAIPVLISYATPYLDGFRVNLIMYFKKIWWAILLGLFIGGLIDHFIPRNYISHVLANKGKRTIFYSIILGFFMSACSHGILAIAIQLHKKGASNPAVVAFLLASPWANLTFTVMMFGFFGLKALYIIISAIIIAINTGLIFQILERRGMIEINSNAVATNKDFSIIYDIKKRLKGHRITKKFFLESVKGVFAGMQSLGDMVLWWMLIGLGLASLVGAYVPNHFFREYMGPTFLGMLVTLGLATVIEMCSEGSAPLGFEIFRQTGALGNSFVFLMAGVVTDYTEIGLLWHNVGRRVAIWLPIITVPQVIILGVIANLIF